MQNISRCLLFTRLKAGGGEKYVSVTVHRGIQNKSVFVNVPSLVQIGLDCCRQNHTICCIMPIDLYTKWDSKFDKQAIVCC